MRSTGSNTNGVGAGVSRLADGGGLETGIVYALHRPRGADAAPLRHNGSTWLLRCETCAIYQVRHLYKVTNYVL